MADMEKFYIDLIAINLYIVLPCCCDVAGEFLIVLLDCCTEVEPAEDDESEPGGLLRHPGGLLRPQHFSAIVW